MNEPSPLVVGIDLGTTNSLISYIKEGKPEIIPNERGSRKTPSVVLFKEDGEIIVGEIAKNQTVLNAERTFSNVKRAMGTKKTFKVGDKIYTPSDVASLILKKLKDYAEKYLDREIKDAVITVPAYFDDNQRAATLQAAIMAGFNVLKLLNEPTAAALVYGYNKRKEGKLLVLDLGGGTLDITLMEYKDNVFRLKGVGGSTSIGGVNFDKAIIKYMIDDFKKMYSVDLGKDNIAYQQLVIHAERAKMDLSSMEEARIMIPFITITEKRPVHLNVVLTRETMEKLVRPYLKDIKKYILETFEDANLPLSWVDSIILVGGATRIPAVEKLVNDLLNKQEIKKGEGAADSQAYKSKLKREIHADEAVAQGAGILAGILEGSLPETKFYDITSHNLGLEDGDGTFVIILPKGASYPTEITRLFTTVKDKQKTVEIHILQDSGLKGKKKMISLGKFQLSIKSKRKKGKPNIDVTFAIDQNGILNTSAIDLDTGDQEEIIISEVGAKAIAIKSLEDK